MDKNEFQSLINVNKRSGKPFRVTLTNYTQRISGGLLDAKELNETKSKKFFLASAMIKKDVSRFEVPVIDSAQNIYFEQNLGKETFFIDEIFGVDLSNAYATILKNAGYITAKTYRYISTLEKLDRLGAIGMLASNKKHFDFVNGEIVNVEEEKSPLSNFFFYAVQKTREIMAQAQAIAQEGSPENYLFTWVDCIYIREAEKLKDIFTFLKSQGLKYKEKNYTQFLAERGEKTIKVTFYEDENIKNFHLPLPKSRVKKAIEEYILNLNKKTKK
jgi:hypothetical protein